jgi:hypothetical protein
MEEDEYEENQSIRKRWDRHAKRYDEWYETLEGAVENYVDWELLKRHLP